MPANIDAENPRVKPVAVPTDKELFFSQDEIIVSKTDLKGRITYANRTFCRIAGYTEAGGARPAAQHRSSSRHAAGGVQTPVGHDPRWARNIRLCEKHGQDRRSRAPLLIRGPA
jgi:PAS domain-containing protein